MHVFADWCVAGASSSLAAVELTTQGCLQQMFSQLLLLVSSCCFVWAILLRVPQVCLVTRKNQSAAASAVMKVQKGCQWALIQKQHDIQSSLIASCSASTVWYWH